MSEKKAEVIKDILEYAKEKLEASDEPTKVVKMEKEWIKLHDEADKARKEALKLKSKAEAIAEEMWGKIRRDLDYPQADLHINDEDMTLEIREK